MRRKVLTLVLLSVLLAASGCIDRSAQESAKIRGRDRPSKPTVRNERSFSELNPHYKERAGAFYDIKYVSPSAEALFRIADVRPEQMRETLNILRAFVYEWLDAYVEGNGSIPEAQVQECIRKMDSRFDVLFDDLQRKQYRIWRDDASGKHNQLRFLMSPSGAKEQDNARPADEQ